MLDKHKFDFKDFNKHIDFEAKLHNWKNINSHYIFYYDETNNIRKLWFKHENKLNIEIEDLSKNFILGGVAHLESQVNFNIDILKNSLNLPPNIKEMKLKHIAKGDFLSCLKSKKLETFLNWLLSNNLLIHYSNLNLLYWSLIDILESMIPKDLFVIHMELKTTLNELVKVNLEQFLLILYKYNYPNIDREKTNDFISDLLDFIKNNKEKLIAKYPLINLDFINLVYQIIQDSKNTELTFIHDEKSHILLDDFFIFYHRPFRIFKNSKHIFDEESSIENIFKNWEFYDSENRWGNFEFQNSKTNDLIQLSDIIVGLLGKLFEYISEVDFNQLNQLKNTLDNQQTNNLIQIVKLIDNSNRQSTALIHTIQSLVDRDKLTLLLTSFKV